MTRSTDPSAETTEYDLAVIGSGSGNSMLDERFADLRIALIDQGTFGGTCLNVGCIPTKMFVLPADTGGATVRLAERLGVHLERTGVDWPSIVERVFADRVDPISRGGLDWRERQPNVDVYQQHAEFVDANTLELSGGDQPTRRIRAERFVLAAGSRPLWPDVPIAAEVADRVHTNDTIMRLPELPEHLVVVGSGFVAAEFAHIFAGLGTRVTWLARHDRVLRSEDEDVSARFTELSAAVLDLRTNEQVTSITAADGHPVVHSRDQQGSEHEYGADAVLVAIGRVPNGDRLNLPAAGVETDDRGFVVVDPYQRTTASHIFALGDVCQPQMLKHVANHEMRVVANNLLHPDALQRANHTNIPHAVFAEPQIGSVGATEQQLRDQGRDYLVQTQDYGTVAYGWALEDQTHFAKFLADPNTGRLLGAHIIGPQAATLVQLPIQMMASDQDVEQAARGQYWIHPALPELIENALLGLVEQRRQWHDAKGQEGRR